MHQTTAFADRLVDDGLIIYGFHGVIERHVHAVRNYNRKHCDREEFLAFLRAARDCGGTPLAMDAVVEHCRTGTLFPPRAFAITFDDGFANNATVAAPILADFKVPATFYCTTGWIGSRVRSWADRLDACLEAASSGALRLPWEAAQRTFATPEERIAILDAIRAHVKRDASLVPDAVVEEILAQCRVDDRETWSASLDAKLSWEQVRALANHEGFTIGGHTHTHAMLSRCTPEACEREIAICLAELREHANVVTTHFSYPEGLAHHYNDAVIARLHAHGVRCCPTAIDGVNTHETDPFHLRRTLVMWRAGMG